jgi:nitroreductase
MSSGRDGVSGYTGKILFLRKVCIEFLRPLVFPLQEKIFSRGNLWLLRTAIFQDSDLKKKLAKASNAQDFIADAPIIIVACGFPDECYRSLGRYMKSWPVDVTIALEHLILQAQEEGLGTCWIGSFEEEEVKSLLAVPENVKVLALTPLGYPGEMPNFRGRKSLEEIISYDSF